MDRTLDGLGLGFFQQYDVGVGVAAEHGEFAAVEGPVDLVDAFGFEVGDLLARGAIERLEPEIIGVLVTEGIHHGFAVVRKADRAG